MKTSNIFPVVLILAVWSPWSTIWGIGYFDDDIMVHLSPGWNLMSFPVNHTVFKNDVMVCCGVVERSWAVAVIDEIINDTLFAWDTSSGIYILVECCEPGRGYWIYSYEACILVVGG